MTLMHINRGYLLVVIIFMMGCNVSVHKTSTPPQIPTNSIIVTLDEKAKLITPSSSELSGFTPSAVTTPTTSPNPGFSPTTPGTDSTPQSKSSPENAKKTVINLLKSNGDCDLPCLWGVIPAESDVFDVRDLALVLGSPKVEGDVIVDFTDYEDVGGMIVVLWDDNPVSHFIDLGYWKTDQKLTILRLHTETSYQEGEMGNLVYKPAYGDPAISRLMGFYLLPQILSKYGKPSQVLLRPFSKYRSDPADYKPIFSVVLVYPDRGFFIEYILPRRETTTHYLACPAESSGFTLITWDPKDHLEIQDVASYGSSNGMNGLNVNSFMTIDQATSITLNDFYQDYQNIEYNGCLSTPKNLWPATTE